MNETDQWKQQAAEAALAYVNSGMVLGLGTGSTTDFALQKLSRLLKEGRLKNITGIPSSHKTLKRAKELGIPTGELNEYPVIDLTIDGADEIDPGLNLIKGGGGALLREKILAQASKQLIIVADEHKLSQRLGSGFALPVEVLPVAWHPERLFIEKLKAEVKLRRREDGELFHTDNGNYILDCRFKKIESPFELAEILQARAGVMAHGLFLQIASRVIIGGSGGLQELERK
ncbi:MAG: ribose-5-phosphate isomerase RpiA [Calditrichia bacterium]